MEYFMDVLNVNVLVEMELGSCNGLQKGLGGDERNNVIEREVMEPFEKVKGE